jgi:hypothetical protein
MELYLQFGYGMMEHCRVLLDSWGGGSVILSPRDLTDDQLVRFGSAIREIPGGDIMLDPQFYLPHSDHEKLCNHAYWPTDYATTLFWQGQALSRLLDSLRDLNGRIGCSRFVLPGLFATTIDDDWGETQRAVLEEARARSDNASLISTIAISADAVRDANQIADLIERAETWNVPTYYVVCEHPNGQYLVDDPNWIANVLDLSAGLRLAGSQVILGYCTHQMLAASAAGVNAIASGTWMNVRSFPPEKFNATYEEEIRQRATWYYCPQALSEYKIPFLDIAHRLGLLHLMAPPPELDGGYATALFSGAQPSTVGFGEQGAFRHYLHALHEQVRRKNRDSFDSAVADCEGTLTAAETLLTRLRTANIHGQLRDFTEIVDVNRAGLGLFSALRGAVMRRQWNTL